jgi:Fe-Mn family superoxide dismutase
MYTLPKLSYAYDALEPYIDKTTMEIHHTKHHQAYIDKLNVALEKYPQLLNKPLVDLLRELINLPMDEADRTVIRNNGGGHANHSLFWEIMGAEKTVDEKLVKEISDTFGSIDEFKEKFTQSASIFFGSGWTWLVRNSVNKLEVYSTTNQDSPYMQGHMPIIGLDVWEHAYYLKYQNRRPEYITNWWQVLKLL